MEFLRDNPGARQKARRVGRGHSSGWGKTSGKGHKGQKARSGVSIKGYEGGQMPFYRRLPKSLGFNSHRPDFTPVDLKRIESLIFHGKIDPKEPLTYEKMLAIGLADKTKKVKILGNMKLSSALTIEGHAISKAAQEALSASKGAFVSLAASSEEGEGAVEAKA